MSGTTFDGPDNNSTTNLIDVTEGPHGIVQRMTPSPPLTNGQVSPVGQELQESYHHVFDLTKSLSQPDGDGDKSEASKLNARRNLDWFGGVLAAVALAQFSTCLFLRVGFVVGQSGIVLAIVQFFLAYFILYMTILSICAISTNGAVEGGGAYYMISRALGPEFGGSIGFLFYLANVFSCALYISGFVEGLIDNFGQDADGGPGLPAGGRWWAYLYASVVLLFCLIVCIIGGAMFARTSVLILAIVVLCTVMVIVSMFVKHSSICVPLPPSNNNSAWPANHTGSLPHQFCKPDKDSTLGANYTSMLGQTFVDNLWAKYGYDYQTKKTMNFFTVFAVLFSSVTGIMNGANMSGELKDPSKAIPKGTLSATLFTFITYIVMALLTGLSSSRELLVNNYNYLKYVNVWGGFVIAGLFAATLSAALGNLIGASRVLEAMARDRLFWMIFKPATITTKSGNPYVAVLISWAFVQLILLVGSLNALAPMTSIFFLLSYASTNLACLALELASAPNFRPTFNYFSWHSCTLGLVGCMVMCFFIDLLYALVALVLFIAIIVALLFFRTFPQSWGSISQALIFHQVRKYLLMLDTRKEHVKFWRPQILLMISNPRSCCETIDFINDVKKGGLYVLGHVKVGHPGKEYTDPCIREYPQWLALVDSMKIKAFVELTLAPTVREGMNHLIRLAGLGGMKPNTVCLGFYDTTPPEDTFEKRQSKKKLKKKWKFYGTTNEDSDVSSQVNEFPNVRESDSDRFFSPEEYFLMLCDSLKLKKNICLLRHFNRLDKDAMFKSGHKHYIDVWPLNFFRPDTSNLFDNTCLFLLQLACILQMVPGWKSHTCLRVFMCVVEENEQVATKHKKLSQLLLQLRILGQIKVIHWHRALSKLNEDGASSQYFAPFPLPDVYLQAVNDMVREQCDKTAVTFLYLPRVRDDTVYKEHYLRHLEMITDGLPPTVMVNGIHPVTSTTL